MEEVASKKNAAIASFPIKVESASLIAAAGELVPMPWTTDDVY